MIKIYHNNSCSKSRCALSILEESGTAFEVINYLEAAPTADELLAVLQRLGIKAHDLIRKTESIYIENYKDKILSDEEWILAMVKNPVLIERPIVISGDRAVIARPAEKIYDILS